MEIMVPINSPEDIRPLCALGAREFYCGLPPVDPSTVISRRDSHLSGGEATAELLKTAQSVGCRIFFTLNMYYAPDVLPLLFDQLEKVREMGRFGLIIGDASLMAFLKKRFGDIPLAASVLGHALNGRAVKFYHEAGCERVILGTHLNEKELNEIVSEWSPHVEMEAFALNSGCFFEDGFCMYEHRVVEDVKEDSAFAAMRHKLTSTVLDRGPRALRRAAYAFGPDDNPCALRPGEIEVRDATGKRRAGLEKAALSFYSLERFKHKCGLCFLRNFKKSGLKAVKIVGREKTLSEKRRDFLTVKAALDFLENDPGEAGYEKACMKLFEKRNGFDCNRGFCYYSR